MPRTAAYLLATQRANSKEIGILLHKAVTGTSMGGEEAVEVLGSGGTDKLNCGRAFAFRRARRSSLSFACHTDIGVASQGLTEPSSVSSRPPLKCWHRFLSTCHTCMIESRSPRTHMPTGLLSLPTTCFASVINATPKLPELAIHYLGMLRSFAVECHVLLHSVNRLRVA